MIHSTFTHEKYNFKKGYTSYRPLFRDHGCRQFSPSLPNQGPSNPIFFMKQDINRIFCGRTGRKYFLNLSHFKNPHCTLKRSRFLNEAPKTKDFHYVPKKTSNPWLLNDVLIFLFKDTIIFFRKKPRILVKV
jgi:hypothetical protein